jgi:hypothetical protein
MPLPFIAAVSVLSGVRPSKHVRDAKQYARARLYRRHPVSGSGLPLTVHRCFHVSRVCEQAHRDEGQRCCSFATSLRAWRGVFYRRYFARDWWRQVVYQVAGLFRAPGRFGAGLIDRRITDGEVQMNARTHT